jgi:hypothetical protein
VTSEKGSALSGEEGALCISIAGFIGKSGFGVLTYEAALKIDLKYAKAY